MKQIFFIFIILLFSIQLSSASADYDAGQIAVIVDADGQISANAITWYYQQKAACVFYKTHGDNYDALFFFAKRKLDFVSNIAMGFPVNSPSKGIGRGEASLASTFCSINGRLRHAVKMGSLSYLTTNPADNYTGITGYTLSGIELMGHEFGHHWLANVDFDKNDGKGKQSIMRANNGNEFNQHWSIRFNQNSVMYANSIKELGGNSFQVWRDVLKYGEIDQYLMGLREPNETSPSFIVSAEYASISDGFPIANGQTSTITGDKIDVSVEDIILAMGPRIPAKETCHWKAAFIIITDPNLAVTQQDLDIVEAYRNRWETWYAFATDDRGSFDASLDGCGTGTKACVGEKSKQCGAMPDGDDESSEIEAEANCTNGERKCDSNILVQCAANGMWTLVQDCGADGMQCVNGKCEQNAACTIGEKKCDGGKLVQCGSGGLWGLVQDCELDGLVCSAASCLKADGDSDAADSLDLTDASSCQPESRVCEGSKIKVCKADGSGYETVIDCSPITCKDGVCFNKGGDNDFGDVETKKGSSSSGCAGGGEWFGIIALLGAALFRSRNKI